MVICPIGFRGVVITPFSMRRPLHSSVHCGSSWPNRDADVKTVLPGMLTRGRHIHDCRPVQSSQNLTPASIVSKINCTSLIISAYMPMDRSRGVGA